MAKSVQARATNRKGDQLTLNSQESDAPILPIAQLQQLYEFRPDLIDFVIAQTEKEADYRRSQTSRLNGFVFAEHILGQVLSVMVALFGIGGGIYAGLNGQAWLGGTIATVTIGTLSVAFLRQQKTK
jgi:hypothetical protein